ncbi:uncharacterized protein LOC143933377 [Lithobates pipiens]
MGGREELHRLLDGQRGVAYGGPRKYKETKNISNHKDLSITIPGITSGDPGNYSKTGTNNISDLEDGGTTVPGFSNSNEMTNVTNGIQDKSTTTEGITSGDPEDYSKTGTNNISHLEDGGTTVPGFSNSNEMTNDTNGIQDKSTTTEDTYSNELANDDHQGQNITTPGFKKHNSSCSTPHSQQTGGTKGDNTLTPASSTKNEVNYWIIGIICGIILLLIIAIVLLYKFYKRDQPDSEFTQEIPSPQGVPSGDVSQLYAKVQKAKSKENCASAVGDVNYSSVKFVKEVPTDKVEQSDTDYSEIKCP